MIEKGLVTNKKTNGFAKSAESSCDHVLRSALIQFQNTAKANGANAVTNLVSLYKSNETRSTTTYQCAKGTALAGVALKGDLVRFLIFNDLNGSTQCKIEYEPFLAFDPYLNLILTNNRYWDILGSQSRLQA